MLHSFKLSIGPETEKKSELTREDHDPITAYLLKNLSEALMDALNTIPDKDAYPFLDKHMAPQWTQYNVGGHECVLPHVKSRQEQIDNVLALRKVYPNWKLKIFQVSALVDPGSEHGVVFYTSTSTGGPDDQFNPYQEMVGKFSWRKRVGDGVWECYGHEGIRGGGDVFS